LYLDLLHTVPATGPLVITGQLALTLVAIGTGVSVVSFLGCCGACADSACFLCLVSSAFARLTEASRLNIRVRIPIAMHHDVGSLKLVAILVSMFDSLLNLNYIQFYAVECMSNDIVGNRSHFDKSIVNDFDQ
jgi:hypothetical protein